MAHSDVEDAASPDPDFDQDDSFDIMTEIHAHKSSTPGAAVKTESNTSGSDQHTPTNGTSAASKPNPKDPSRPRRKKARRACFACQRAHLTCGMYAWMVLFWSRSLRDILGDERPCQRCIKRGLQDQCHDGVRKKAKYLSDTPAELLNPPGMAHYHPSYINGTKNKSNDKPSDVPMTSSHETGHYHPQPQTPTIDVYGQQPGPPHMQPPLSTAGSYGHQQSPLSPEFSQHPSQPQHIAQTMAQAQQGMTQFNGLPFDPSDPALFNFDIASLNFGNQYGALEFGMLNHMSSVANGEQGPPEMMNQLGQISGFNQGYTDPALTFSQDAFVNANWDNNQPRASSTSGLLQTPHNTPMMTSVDRHDSISHFPKGYAIGAGPSSMSTASPAASAGIPDAPLDNPQSPALFLTAPQPSSSPAIARHQPTPSMQQQTQQPVQPPASTDLYNQAYQTPLQPANPLKRAYDADIIYETVNKPYPYTTGFHRLFHYISANFSSEKRLRVAKAVAAIRPSLITFSQGLTEKDLIFMERSVQRKLYEFHDFLQLTGTPTIMARRDGAIVSASKEFSILTGWSKQVLLGREPNLNVNSGNASAGSTAPGSAARTRFSSVDRESPVAERNSSGPQSGTSMPTPPPVLLAEILDQDTVVQFYEDYAKLAFSSAGGSVLRRGRLLKYRTKSDAPIPNNNVENNNNDDERALKKRKRSQSIKQEHAESGTATYVKGEHGITQLGEVEGSVDVMYCWACRRDVFEVPTLIVMNVSFVLFGSLMQKVTDKLDSFFLSYNDGLESAGIDGLQKSIDGSSFRWSSRNSACTYDTRRTRTCFRRA